MPTLSSERRNIREYVSGFVDGEGCFSVSFSKRPKFIVGWETKPSLAVSQNHDRAEPLFLMQSIFKCGFMRDGITDNTVKYEVRRLDDLIKKVIPHFERYPLLSSKYKDFLIFKKICLMMKRSEHRNLKGFKKILSLAIQMNGSGRRKYSEEYILNVLKFQKLR